APLIRVRSVVRIYPGPPLFQWGCSSAGRAPALQAGGQRFDPAQLHHVFVGFQRFFSSLETQLLRKARHLVPCPFLGGISRELSASLPADWTDMRLRAQRSKKSVED